jgi:acetyl esterase
VLSIDYALSPEHRFPVAFNEVVAIISRVIKLGAITDCPLRGYALGGDSAGANLALGAAIALRDSGVDALRQLLLFYGSFSRDMSSDSWQRLGGYAGHNLSVETMSAYWASYLTNDEDDWRVQPIIADLAGLPPARLVVGELDPLLDENRELAQRLRNAGVTTNLQVLPDMSVSMKWRPSPAASWRSRAAPCVRRFPGRRTSHEPFPHRGLCLCLLRHVHGDGCRHAAGRACRRGYCAVGLLSLA